jgi:hypothetical protein
MTPRKKSPPKLRIPLPRKPPKVIEPPTIYRRKPKHPKNDERETMNDETKKP